jgi:PKD repeat protein
VEQERGKQASVQNALWLTEKPETRTVEQDGSQQIIKVTFDSKVVSELGIYSTDITIKINDPVNKKSVIPVTMTVVAPATPTVSFTFNTPVLVGNPLAFTNTRDPGQPPATEYLWDFGDGIAETVGMTASVSHVYATFGTFTVSLKACNVVGCDTLRKMWWFSRGSASSRC